MEPPSWNFLPLSVFLQLPNLSQATLPQEALLDCLSPQSALILASGAPEDHGQYHLVGNQTLVTAGSPNWRRGLNSRDGGGRGAAFPSSPASRSVLKEPLGDD